MEHDLEDRSVVVTGGTGYLGTAVVERLLCAGARVHVVYAREVELQRFPFAEHQGVQMHHVDCLCEDSVVGLYGALGGLWASVHVVGGFAADPIESTTLDQFDDMIDLNARTCFLCCREAIENLRAGGRGGRIVNVGARPAVEPVGGMVAYAASKAAVVSITQSLAQELIDERILVNAVMPSIIDTPANRNAMPDEDHGAWPRAEQVAEAIAFLASPRNQLTTGALVPVYGRI